MRIRTLPQAVALACLSMSVAHAQAPEKVLPVVTVTAEPDATTEGTGSYTTRSTNTATKLPLTLRETPQSVTVLTHQRIEDQGLTQLSDVYRQVPGLYFQQSGMQGTDSNTVYSRGFAVENYQVDGVPQSTTNSWLLQTADLAIYDRVEIIRGATGLMSGPGTPAATINLIRKRPTQEFQSRIEITGGSWDYYRGDVDVSGPLNTYGNVRGRFVAAWQDNNSFMERAEESKQILYGIVDIDITSATRLSLGASYLKHDADAQARAGFPLFNADGSHSDFSRSDNAGADWAHSYQTQRTFFASLDHEFNNDWKLKTSVEHSRRKYDDVVGYASGGALDPATGGGLSIWANMWKSEYIQDSLDLYLTGAFELFGRKHDMVVGYNVSRMRYDDAPWANWSQLPIPNFYTWDGDTPGEPAWPTNPSLTDFEEHQRGLYGTVRLRPTDALSLIGGARVSDWDQQYTNDGVRDDRRSETGVVTPYAGIVYDLTKTWSIYASYTDIFKPQNNKGANEQFLDPETGESYEAGVKAGFFEDRLNFSAAIFKIKQDNLAELLPNPNPQGYYRAISGTETTGFELEISGEITPQWHIAGGYTHRKSEGPNGESINTDAPRNQFKLFTTYELAGVGNGLTVGGGVSWQGSTYSNDVGPPPNYDQRFRQEDYTVVDLMARYKLDKHTTLLLNIYNLFDEEYYTSTWSAYYGTPRNARLTLSYDF